MASLPPTVDVRELPATILAARNRSLVVKKIREALRSAGEPLEEGP